MELGHMFTCFRACKHVTWWSQQDWPSVNIWVRLDLPAHLQRGFFSLKGPGWPFKSSAICRLVGNASNAPLWYHQRFRQSHQSRLSFSQRAMWHVCARITVCRRNHGINTAWSQHPKQTLNGSCDISESAPEWCQTSLQRLGRRTQPSQSTERRETCLLWMQGTRRRGGYM